MLELSPLSHGAPLACVVPEGIETQGLIVGRPVEEAAAILPRIFNLCRGAQGAAARLAFGLPLGEDEEDAVQQEILRDHLLMLCIKLPRHLGTSPMGLPSGWQADPTVLQRELFGLRGLPATLSGLEDFMRQSAGQIGGFATLLRQVDALFARGEAVCQPLPFAEAAEMFDGVALENSVAGRQADHPLMRAVEAEKGRGPFWRVLGRLIELEALTNRTRMPLSAAPDGLAVVQAARGAYAIRASVENGRVTAFKRVTPTDHLLAQGGVMDQSLARLSQNKAGLGALLLDILDPCVPVRLKEVV